MSTYRRRTDNAVLLHSNVSALAFPTGSPTTALLNEKVRASDGTAPRFVEIRIIAKGAGPAVIPGPIYLCGNEDVALSQGGNQTDEWNRIGAALFGGATNISVTNKQAVSDIVELKAGCRALALFNSGGAFTGGTNVDVQLIPLFESYS